MAYSGVYVFGDSLVDAGNALKLAEAYNYFPFTSLPDGAPTSVKGYHSGNFTNGWTFADLLSNKYLSEPTQSLFPYGYDDPFLGISFDFFSDPDGRNFNFAYGGGQIRQGDEAVPDMDDQTDAYRDAVDGEADPNALHMFVFGANDVHDLVPSSGTWTDEASARSVLQRAADEYIEEVLQTIEIGAEHILLIGIPDIGIQPYYNGSTSEAARRAVATEYTQILDGMIQAQLGELAIPGVEVRYIPFADLAGSVLGTMVDLYGESEIYPLNLSNEVFFDRIHPTAQAHALAAAYITDLLSGSPAGETMPLISPHYSKSGLIGAEGETDLVTISLAANTSYTFNLLGISTLGGNVTVLADPLLAVFGPTGTLVGSNDDGGLGLDSSFTFTSGAAGDYTIHLGAVGAMTGTYSFQAAGQATGNNSYTVSHAGAIILENIGGGFDTVRSSVSYALNAGAEIEMLRTTNDKGKGAINLTGNEFGQTLVGNAGNNILEGKAGADVLTGGSGKDVFVLSNAAVTNPGSQNIDRITDYGSGDVVDISQILNVAAGTNIVGGGYVRVTTNGLVQVDVDGGGNNWMTLSQINNGGAVTFKYLLGGSPTNVAVSRVSATSSSIMASSVAAAGLAVMTDTHLANDTAVTQSLSDGILLAAGAVQAELPALTRAGQFALGEGAGELALASPKVQPVSAKQGWHDDADVGVLAPHVLTKSDPAVGIASETHHIAPAADAAIPSAALTVAVPSAQMLELHALNGEPNVDAALTDLAEILADALQALPEGPNIGELLRGLAAKFGFGSNADWLSGDLANTRQEANMVFDSDVLAAMTEFGKYHPDVSQPV